MAGRTGAAVWVGAAWLGACGAPAVPADLPSVWVEPSSGMEFVLVRPGHFDMGLTDPPDDLRPAPVHQVELTRPFYFGRMEVTQGEWLRVMGDAPSQFADCGEACPVESVSWWDVQSFLDRLRSGAPGEEFRLPTEAEWEYACRAGSEGRYANGIDTLRPDLANYDARIPFDGISGDAFVGKPAPVGSFPPNAWGLHDLSGNVWEWTADEYCPYPGAPAVDPRAQCGTDTMAIRGGSWFFSANAARCGRRYTHARGDSGFSLGFRVVRSVP